MHAWCREHGLFDLHLGSWRTAICEPGKANHGTRDLRNLKDENEQLKRDLVHKEKALLEAAALLIPQKKFRPLWEGLVHTVRGASGHVSDIAEGNTLLHGDESVAFGDAGYQGIEKRADATPDVTWHVAMRPGKGKALDKDKEADAMTDKAEKLKAGIRAKGEHPFRVIKRQFGAKALQSAKRAHRATENDAILRDFS